MTRDELDRFICGDFLKTYGVFFDDKKSFNADYQRIQDYLWSEKEKLAAIGMPPRCYALCASLGSLLLEYVAAGGVLAFGNNEVRREEVLNA